MSQSLIEQHVESETLIAMSHIHINQLMLNVQDPSPEVQYVTVSRIVQSTRFCGIGAMPNCPPLLTGLDLGLSLLPARKTFDCRV